MKIQVLAVTVLLAAAQVGRAQVKDLAELFPATTRVYLEINGIADVVKEVRGLVKGSCLEDPPKSLEKFAELAHNQFYFGDFLEYGLLVCPEALAEISRFRGGAFAVTGLPSGKDPEFVGVLLAGPSNLPAIFMRDLMSVPFGKKVAEVEGVRLYRSRVQAYEVAPVDGKQENREFGPVMALMPGVAIVGSNTEAVGDVIRRWKGKAKGASLASMADFQKAADLRKQPGLFTYADGSSLVQFCAWVAQALRPRPQVPLALKSPEKQAEFVHFKQEKEVGSQYQELLALAGGFKAVRFNLALKDGSALVQGNAVLDPKAKTPWHDFFSRRTIDLNHLRFMPKHSRLALLAALPEGTGFWDKLGKAAPLLETELSLALGKDLLKIARAGWIDAGKNGPVLMAEATDAASAPNLAETMGKFFKKESQTKGRLIVLGSDRKFLAEMLAGKGLGADKKMLDALKDHEQAQVLLTLSVGQTVLEGIREDAKRPSDLRIEFEKKPPPKKVDALLKEIKKQLARLEEIETQLKEGGPPLAPSKKLLELARRSAELLEPMPPFVLSLSKKSDQVILHGRQIQLQTLMPRLIDVMVEWELNSPRNREYAMPPPPVKEAPKESK
jgi:hypothetical protein